MRWLGALATRLLPTVFLVMGIIMVAQFWQQNDPAYSSTRHFFHRTEDYLRSVTWYMLGVAGVSWAFAWASVRHEKKRQLRIQGNKEGWLMDILDRLTNRQALEQKLSKETESVFINADQLATALKSKVIGQDAVCDDLAAQIRRRMALKQRDKPVGVFMLAGPPGTGKTYLGKCLAKELQRHLLHLDMTQFSRGGSAATQLFGTSKGYVGSDSYGKLTASLRDIPDSVVLLDEFEKAHSEVHKNFLTAWNDGFVTEASDGRQISTSRAIFVMTTNAATNALEELSQRFAKEPDELRRASVNALRESGFAPEVLNRIDRIFVFNPLKGLDIARVTALEIEDMIQSYGLNVADGGIDPDVLMDMMRRYSSLGGNASSRDLLRAVEESIADTLINAKQQGYTRISLISRNGAVVAQPVA